MIIGTLSGLDLGTEQTGTVFFFQERIQMLNLTKNT